MKEDIIKILNIGDITTVAQRLKEIGAKELWSGNQTIITFDWSKEFYHEQDIVICLTQAGSYSKFTVYTESSSSYACKAYRTHIGSDYEQTYGALIALGFIPYTKVETLFYDFVYNNASIHLNKFPEIPAFMEFNGDSISITSLIYNLNLSGYSICDLGTEAIHNKYGINYFKAYHV